MSIALTSGNAYILRTVAEKPARKRFNAARTWWGKTILVLLASTMLVALGSGGLATTQAARADWFGFCQNPSKDSVPAASYGSNMDAAIPASAVGDSTRQTAMEWYGPGARTWGYYSWDDLGETTQGCRVINQIYSFVGSAALQLAGLQSLVSSWMISSLTTADVVGFLFTNDENGILPNIVRALKDGLFLNYLAPIVLISALFLAWRGLVQRRTRESLQGVVWMFGSAAAALLFLVNPTWFASVANNVTYTTSSYVIESIAAAGTAADDSQGCDLPVNSPNAPSRRISCAFWNTFVYTPWAAGQMGVEGMGVKNESLKSTFRDVSNLPYALMDVTSGKLTSADANKAQWNDVTTAVLQYKGTDGQSYSSSNPAPWWGLWAGSDAVTMNAIGLSAYIGQTISIFPILLLALEMLMQQIMFVLLLTVSPIFLTIGINPGLGRRLSMGWLEMILSTLVKRVILAGLIGVILAYCGAVTSIASMGANSGQGVTEGSTASSVLMQGTYVGASAIIQIYLQTLLLGAGSIAIYLLRGRLLNRMSGFVNLGGERITDGGKTKAFLSSLGSGLAGAVAGGVGAKLGGESFADGAKQGYAGPNPLSGRLLNAGSSAYGMAKQRGEALEKATGVVGEHGALAGALAVHPDEVSAETHPRVVVEAAAAYRETAGKAAATAQAQRTRVEQLAAKERAAAEQLRERSMAGTTQEITAAQAEVVRLEALASSSRIPDLSVTTSLAQARQTLSQVTDNIARRQSKADQQLADMTSKIQTNMAQALEKIELELDARQASAMDKYQTAMERALDRSQAGAQRVLDRAEAQGVKAKNLPEL